MTLSRIPNRQAKKSRIPCLNFGKSRFPGSSQIPNPVKIFCVSPNPAPYFGQIPDPENTLPDPDKRSDVSVLSSQRIPLLAVICKTCYFLYHGCRKCLQDPSYSVAVFFHHIEATASYVYMIVVEIESLIKTSHLHCLMLWRC